MNSKGMRLEIKPWLYKVLVEHQELLKNQTGRKTSLVDILLDFCHKGIKAYKARKIVRKNVRNLAQNEHYNVLNATDKPKNRDHLVQNEDHLAQNSAPNPKQNVLNEYIIEQIKILEYKEKALNNREKRLSEREKRLTHKENVLNQKNAHYFAQKEQLLEQREKNLEKHADNLFNKHSLGQLNNEIEDKETMIQKLENIISKQDDKINQLLSSVNNLKENSKKVSTIERIMPFITPLLSIAGFFLLNNKIKNVKELEPVQKQIEGLLKSLNDDDRKLLMELLKNNDIDGK